MNRFRRQMVATAAALGVAAIAAASASAAPTATTIPLSPGSQTEGITRGPDGALWFANFGTQEIGRVTSGLAGSFSLPNPGPPPMSGPFDITVGPDNNLWFTAFNGTIGKLVPGLGITGYQAVPSPTANLKGIAPGSGSTLWYLEAEGDMLRSITTTGSPGVAINLGPTGLNLGAPDGITAGVGGDTNVYFTTDSGWIGKKDTNSVSPVTAASLGGVDANGITVGPDGNLWVTTASGVTKVSPGGGGAPSVLQGFPVQGAAPRGITTGPDGALWFAESGSNSVGRITLDGQVSSIPLSGCALPDDIALHPTDKSLWVTCFGSPALVRITESGATPPAPTPPRGGGAIPVAGLKASFTVKKTVIAGKVFTVKVKFNKAVTKTQVRVQIRSANTKLKGSIKKFKTIKSKLITGTQGSIPVKIAKPGLYKLRLSYKNGPKSVNTNAVKLTVKPRPRR